MTRKFKQYENYKVDHTKFGGIIYPSDFNTDCRGKYTPNGSSYASRIINDWNFDKQCQKNIENNNAESIGRDKND